MDDRRVGRSLRALRHRLRLRQVDVATRSSVSQDVVSRMERGRLEALSLRILRRVLASLDAELVVYVRWRGGDLDRLLDAGHAALVSDVHERLSQFAWAVEVEVSYSEFGERGSMDLLGWHPASRTLLVVEVKTELTSIEETLRKHDAKTRLAARVALARFGWSATAVARLLILPDRTVARDRVGQHAGVFAKQYPLRGVLLRRWLLDPGSEAAVRGGLWFLRLNDGMRRTRQPSATKRVRASDRRSLDRN